MFIATFCFWLGRREFIHVPAAGKAFIKEVFSPTGMKSIMQMSVIFSFVMIFWSLFDQTASTWVFQSQDMNRKVFGFEVLPSQIIGIGLFITATAFAVSALIQEWIDAGHEPSIWWQILAYALLTTGEIMVSIVCLEFAYTHASKSMKSLVMGVFLLTVSFGNKMTSIINGYIQVENPTALEMADFQKQKEQNSEAQYLRYAGYDGEKHTGKELTQWDSSVVISYTPETDQGTKVEKLTWIEKRNRALGLTDSSVSDHGISENVEKSDKNTVYALEYQAGGLLHMEGASYFWFFTILMLSSSVIYIPVASAIGKRLTKEPVNDGDDFSDAPQEKELLEKEQQEPVEYNE